MSKSIFTYFRRHSRGTTASKVLKFQGSGSWHTVTDFSQNITKNSLGYSNDDPVEEATHKIEGAVDRNHSRRSRFSAFKTLKC